MAYTMGTQSWEAHARPGPEPRVCSHPPHLLRTQVEGGTPCWKSIWKRLFFFWTFISEHLLWLWFQAIRWVDGFSNTKLRSWQPFQALFLGSPHTHKRKRNRRQRVCKGFHTGPSVEVCRHSHTSCGSATLQTSNTEPTGHCRRLSLQSRRFWSDEEGVVQDNNVKMY